MPQDNIRHIGIKLLGHLLQPVNVPDKHRGRVLLTEIPIYALLSHGFAMPQVILSGHNDTSVSQKFRKLLIAFHVFCHSVHNLHDADNRLLRLRHPPDRMNPAFPVPGIKIKFFL